MNDFTEKIDLREQQAQAISDLMYRTFLQAVDGLTEDELDWQFFAMRAVRKLVDGIIMSEQARLNGRDFLKHQPPLLDLFTGPEKKETGPEGQEEKNGDV